MVADAAPLAAQSCGTAAGRMDALVRAKDWSTTPLGPREQWPQSLRSVIGLILAAPLPMIVLWGPGLTQIYNDGYAEIAGARHPAALGQPTRECWPEIWHFNGPIYEAVLRGETRSFTGQHLGLQRRGAVEDAWFDLSYSPLHDDSGAIAGVLVTVIEVTDRVLAERRLHFLLEVEQTLRPLRDPTEVLGAACRMLGRQLDAAVAYAEIDRTGEHAVIGLAWTNGTLPGDVSQHRLTDYGPAMIADLRRGHTVAIGDVALDPRTATEHALAAFRRVQIAAFLNVPLVKDGTLLGILAVHSRAPRRWTPAEIRLAQETAERTWAAYERARAEAALRENEQRFRRMADAVPQIIWITDAEGRAEFWNRQWFAYTGAPDAPTDAGRVAAQFLHPDDQAVTMDAFQAAQRSGGPFLVEHRIRSATGEYRWFLVRGEPQRDPQSGRILRWFGASIDIDDRRRTEAALREREERLRLIVENARDYAIYTTDPAGVIDAWLPGAATVFGWTAEEAVGRSFAITFTAEDRERGVPEQELAGARRDGRAPNTRQHLCKNGTRVLIEGSVTALRRPDGSVRGFLMIGQDVTERRAAEEARALLAREVDHRAKNALTVVQTMLRLTRAEDVPSFVRAVEGRVAALARAQTLLAEGGWSGAALDTMLGRELAPFLAGQRIELRGPRVVLPPATAQPLAMAAHELATNAAKHGALSVPEGRVAVSWCVEGEAPETLKLRWAESGGPPLRSRPARSGFGSRVLDGTVQRQLGGRVSLAWERTGLVCDVEVPLDRAR
jgi:PAS domain S-box-containing protein